MKLRGGNVFSRVYLSVILSVYVCVGGLGSHVTTTHDAMDLTIQGPPYTGIQPHLPVQDPNLGLLV